MNLDPPYDRLTVHRHFCSIKIPSNVVIVMRLPVRGHVEILAETVTNLHP
jgi:hypothetical protein